MALQSAVGTFASATATGNQDVTGLGFNPVNGDALILWSAGSPTTLDSVTNSWRMFVGVATSSSNQYCVSGASLNAASNTSRRVSTTIIGIVQWSEANAGIASLSAWITDGFRLNWTSAPASAYEIHYLILHGCTAKALQWAMPTAAGNTSVTGAGFPPTGVLHISHWAQSSGDSLALDTAVRGAGISLGAQSSAADWGVGFGDGDARTTTDRDYNGGSGSTLVSPFLTTGGQKNYRLDRVSLDADGFTLNVIDDALTTPPPSATPVVSLCFSGIQVAVGGLTKPTGSAPATTSVTGLAFQPSAVFFGFLTQPANLGAGASDVRVGMGAVDSALNQASTVVYADDNVAAASSVAKSVDSATYGVNKATTTVLASGSITALNSDGFSLSFSPNDSSGDFIGYLALASVASAAGSGRLSTLGAGR